MIPLRSFFRSNGTERALGKAFLLGRVSARDNLCKAPSIIQKTTKRHSGHNVMNIEPSNYDWKHLKNMMHFYTLIGAVPVIVVSTIINIRANPELTEIPEGYEPRHWEYYKHPLTRFMAKHFSIPMEMEHEMLLSFAEWESESLIMRRIRDNVEKAMKFYNDHRSNYFQPFYADYYRGGRDEANYGIRSMAYNENVYYDYAFDQKETPVPVEGYPTSD